MPVLYLLCCLRYLMFAPFCRGRRPRYPIRGSMPFQTKLPDFCQPHCANPTRQIPIDRTRRADKSSQNATKLGPLLSYQCAHPTRKATDNAQMTTDKTKHFCTFAAFFRIHAKTQTHGPGVLTEIRSQSLRTKMEKTIAPLRYQSILCGPCRAVYPPRRVRDFPAVQPARGKYEETSPTQNRVSFEKNAIFPPSISLSDFLNHVSAARAPALSICTLHSAICTLYSVLAARPPTHSVIRSRPSPFAPRHCYSPRAKKLPSRVSLEYQSRDHFHRIPRAKRSSATQHCYSPKKDFAHVFRVSLPP